MAIEVNALITEIKESRKQSSASQKDEVRVMQAMLNDTTYEVGVYSAKGKIDTYNPAKDFRAMEANIIASAAKVSKDEAASLVEKYEVSKNDATTMVNVSKEFINTYLNCGRKLALGGREDSSYALLVKDTPKTEKVYQKRTNHDDGTVTWEPATKVIPAHKTLKAKSSCPSWVE